MSVASPRDLHARRAHLANGALTALNAGNALRGDEASAVCAFGRQMHGAGLAFDRLLVHVATLHPEIFARLLAWSPNEPVEVYEQDHPATLAAGFPGSPFREVANSRQKLVLPTVELQFLGRAAGALLQSRGVGEVACVPVHDRSGRTVVFSFCTARPNRFSAADHRIIDGLVGSLAKERKHQTNHRHRPI
jgi:adenylate cyclase